MSTLIAQQPPATCLRLETSDEDLLATAQKLGLDMAKFKADMESPELLAKIKSDAAVATKIDARGTPSFVINGKKQVGWGSTAGIQSMIDSELKAMEGLTAGGMSVPDALKKRAKDLAEKPEEGDVVIQNMLEGKTATQP